MRPPTKMEHVNGKGKKKREKLDGGDTIRSDPHHRPLEQLEGNQMSSTISVSDEGAAPSIYVVVTLFMSPRRPYNIYKLDYPYTGSDGSPKRLHRLVTLHTANGKSFVSVQTPHRKWIVGVGCQDEGGSHTIIFDTKTKAVIHGPDLLQAKDYPALVSVDDKIYALSSDPSVDEGDGDFKPWFEVLDLSQGKVVDGRLEACSWKELPAPPCFPHEMSLKKCPSYLQPTAEVESYLVVGSYILVSLSDFGTYAFNITSAKWQQVDSKNLPIKGYAVPNGSGDIFLGMSSEGKPPLVSAYRIKLCPASPSNNVSTTSEEKVNPPMVLSVDQFPLKSETCKVTEMYFSSVDKGNFCSLSWKPDHRILSVGDLWVPSDDERFADMYSDDESSLHIPKKACMNLEIYRMEDFVLHWREETLPIMVQEIAISKQLDKAFKVHTKYSEGFFAPAFFTVFNP